MNILSRNDVNLTVLLHLLLIAIFRGSGGKPFSDGDREKWLIVGAAGLVALLAVIGFWEMGYKEIGWKEFVHGYVNA